MEEASIRNAGEVNLRRIGVRTINVKSEGRVVVIRIDPTDYRNRRLAEQLSDSWLSRNSGKSYAVVYCHRQSIDKFLRYLEDRSVRQDVSLGSDPRLVVEFLLEWSTSLVSKYRPGSQMPYRLSTSLQGTIDLAARTVGAEDSLLTYIAENSILQKPEPTEVPEFSREERRSIVQAARQHVRIFEATQRWATAQIEKSTSLSPDRQEIGTLLLAARDMALSPVDLAESDAKWIKEALPDDFLRIHTVTRTVELIYAAIHPSVHELFAYRLLLLEATGLSADEITSLTLSQFTETAGGRLALNVVKSRAGKSRTVTFSVSDARSPWGVLGILARIDRATEYVRKHAAVEFSGALWLTFRRVADQGRYEPYQSEFKRSSTNLKSWSRTASSIGFDLNLTSPQDIRRIRKSKVAERAVALRGNMSDIVKDEHTINVFNQYYAHSTSIQVYSAERVVNSQKNLSSALKDGFVAFKVGREEVDAEEIERISGVRPEEAEAIKSGRNDMLVADCKSPHEPPFGPKGILCQYSPMYCLACENAIVFPTHAPYIRDFVESIERERESTAPEEWISTWGTQYASATRVLSEIDGLRVNEEPPGTRQSGVPAWIGWDDE